MKRDDISLAAKLERELSEAERRLEFFSTVNKLNISSACCYELENYPEPSDIGDAFRGVRASLMKLFTTQVESLKDQLAHIGVE